MFRFENETCRDIVEPLYRAFQTDPPQKRVACPEALRGALRRTYQELGAEVEFLIEEADPYPAAQACDGVLIGYSGGKDSLAAVIRCMEMDKGPPILFHVGSVNPINPTEPELTKEVARKLGLELVVRHGPGGKRVFPDNPVKNLLIVAMMVDYGSERGIRYYSEGLHSTHLMAGQNIRYNWSCAREMIDAGSGWFRQVYPAYEWLWILTHDATESLKIVCDFNFELLKSTVSCVHPYRFREMRRKNLMARYGVDILPYRCGMCWKCAVEHMTLACMGHVDFDDAYLRHCYETFRRGLVVDYNAGKASKIAERNDPTEIVNLAINKAFVDNTRLLEMLTA